jgi:soluble lytic murein transglycosylase-like protein
VKEPSVAPVRASSPDSDLIDEVLAKRAPDLGFTLRQQLGAAIEEESRLAGYDPFLILAIIEVESSFDDGAVSPKGARGLMQIRPSTLKFLANTYGIRLTLKEVESDPALRVRLGIRYLRALENRFHDLDLSLMAYNAGPAKLHRVLKAKRADEFRTYSRLVRRRFRRFREGQGLDGQWAMAERAAGHL